MHSRNVELAHTSRLRFSLFPTLYFFHSVPLAHVSHVLSFTPFSAESLVYTRALTHTFARLLSVKIYMSLLCICAFLSVSLFVLLWSFALSPRLGNNPSAWWGLLLQASHALYMTAYRIFSPLHKLVHMHTFGSVGIWPTEFIYSFINSPWLNFTKELWYDTKKWLTKLFSWLTRFFPWLHSTCLA